MPNNKLGEEKYLWPKCPKKSRKNDRGRIHKKQTGMSM